MARQREVRDVVGLQALEITADRLAVQLDNTCQGKVVMDGKRVRDVRRVTIDVQPGRPPKVRLETLAPPQ